MKHIRSMAMIEGHEVVEYIEVSVSYTIHKFRAGCNAVECAERDTHDYFIAHRITVDGDCDSYLLGSVID